MVDEFVLYDDVQYTRRDWRNRNSIKTLNGPLWLTIPVEVKGKYYQSIKETLISDREWNIKHWKSIVHNYAKAANFKDYFSLFEDLYLGASECYLSQVNYRLIMAICQLLGIKTKISWSMDYKLVEGKTDRLIDLCKQAGATEYISGPAAKNYIDENMFKVEGISLSYIDYSGYPEYPQLYPPFEHKVSIIDLILNTGSDARKYMRSF